MTEEQFPMVTFSVPDAEIAKLSELYNGADASTKDGYAMVMAGLRECRTARNVLERERVEKKSGAIKYGKALDAEARRIKSLILEVENPLIDTRKEADSQKESEIQAKKDEERQKREDEEIKARAEREKIEKIARDKRDAEHQARMAEEKARLDAERVEIEKEQKALRVEVERQQAIIDQKAKEQQVEIDRIRAEAEVEANRLAAEKKEAEEEQHRLALIEQEELREIRAELARKQEEAEKILHMQQEKERIEREKLEEALRLTNERNARKEFAKDIEALHAYAKSVESVQPAPSGCLNTTQGSELMDQAHDMVRDAAEIIWSAIDQYKRASKNDYEKPEPSCVQELNTVKGQVT